MRTLSESSWPGHVVPWRAAVGLALLVGFSAVTCPSRVVADTHPQDTLIAVLYGDQSDPGCFDANGDGALTVADILLLPAEALIDGCVAGLVPHAVGDQLVYHVTSPTGKVTTETTIVNSLDADGAFVVDDQQVDGQKVIRHELQSYTDTGPQLFFAGGSDLLKNLTTTCDPLLLRLMMPLVAQEVFSTTTRCNVKFTNNGTPVGFIDRIDTFTPIDIVEMVTVEAGTYTQVVHINGSTDLTGDIETDEIFLAPGVGVVLQLSTSNGQTTRHELVDGTIGGMSVKR